MEEKVSKLSTKEAIKLLPDSETIHTFRNLMGMLLGCDWDKKEIISALEEVSEIQETGEMAQNMGHGLVIEHDGALLFIETKKIEEGE